MNQKNVGPCLAVVKVGSNGTITYNRIGDGKLIGVTEAVRKYSHEVGSVLEISELFEIDGLTFLVVKDAGKVRLLAKDQSDPSVKAWLDSRGEPAPTASEEAEAPAPKKPKAHAIPDPPKRLLIDPRKWETIVTCAKSGINVFLAGPKGCGKTLTAECLSEALGCQFVQFNLAQADKPKRFFIGAMQVDRSGTKLCESLFLKAFGSPDPTVLFVDEFTRQLPGVGNYLMTAFDPRDPYLYVEDEGRFVKKGKNVILVAAGNMGASYVDTRFVDAAHRDRFQTIRLEYLPPSEEVKLLTDRYPGADASEVETLVKIANVTREAEKVGALKTSVSTRQLDQLARMLDVGLDWKIVLEGLMNNFVNGTVDEREIVTPMLQGAGLI